MQFKWEQWISSRALRGGQPSICQLLCIVILPSFFYVIVSESLTLFWYGVAFLHFIFACCTAIILFAVNHVLLQFFCCFGKHAVGVAWRTVRDPNKEFSMAKQKKTTNALAPAV